MQTFESFKEDIKLFSIRDLKAAISLGYLNLTSIKPENVEATKMRIKELERELGQRSRHNLV